MSKKIVCWIGDAPNHHALVAKIAATHKIAGIIIDKKLKGTKRSSFLQLPGKLFDKVRFGKIDKAWTNLQRYYQNKFPGLPDIQQITVDSINSVQALNFTKRIAPDLVVVSGTSLIKEPLVSLPLPIGILNLHTGLSPYVKGGPNCTNWCIANDQWGLIGNTIFWLSAGIDSGNILLSEKIDVSGIQDLGSIHLCVMENAHELYLSAIDHVLTHEPPYQSIPQQSLGKGNLYLTKMWTAERKKQLLKNLAGNRNIKPAGDIKTVPLPS